MKTLNDVLERLRGESRATVVQIEARECAVMADVIDAEAARFRWLEAVEALCRSSPRHGRSLRAATLIKLEQGCAEVVFGQLARFHRSVVLGLSRGLIETELTKHFGRPFRLVDHHADEPLGPEAA